MSILLFLLFLILLLKHFFILLIDILDSAFDYVVIEVINIVPGSTFCPECIENVFSHYLVILHRLTYGTHADLSWVHRVYNLLREPTLNTVFA